MDFLLVLLVNLLSIISLSVKGKTLSSAFPWTFPSPKFVAVAFPVYPAFSGIGRVALCIYL